ncbi:MAG TPA: substrate-binding domain-containing protein [Chloroflexota bacterium]|nr:substrate-binding domain-containing protein [Chloroflexota bacterium]
MPREFSEVLTMLRSLRLVVVALTLALVSSLTLAPAAAQPSNLELILATTTSTQDSGLLDVLVPEFQRQSGYTVKTISVGTGQAMALGERGEADVLLVHAPDSEKKWMEAGHGVDRKLVMYNDFVIVGPPSDPISLAGAQSAVEAMQKIAANGALFVSRGDNSGTHQLELKLWTDAGFDPKGTPWYQEAGQGMGAVLTIANEKEAYTITDRGTYLARKPTLDLTVLAEGYQTFLNVYHVMVVNPEKGNHVNVEGARVFADFIVAPATQTTISTFGVEKFGQPLFFPAATMTDAQLGV